MNEGVNLTPEQAARSLRIVRLVSFGASAGLALFVLLILAMLRYPLQRPAANTGDVVLSEIAVPIEPRESRQAPRPERAREPVDEPPPAPPPAPSPEPAAAAASEPVIVTDPVWLERPRNPERFYPREAFMEGVAGEVVLNCDVDAGGRLTCSVVSETPEGRGFGDAALRIARAHVMQPPMRNGAPSRARYRMVVPFSPNG